MGAALLACRLLLAGVFVSAGMAKLGDLAGSRQAVSEFGVPERIARVVGGLLPVLELAIGVGLVVTASARFGALGAALLLVSFIAAIGNALARGHTPDCHCFGQVHSAPAGRATLVRNVALLAVAGFVAVEGWKHPGVSATHWLTVTSAAWLVGITAGLVIGGLITFQVWFSLALLSQNGRTLLRIEALETAMGRLLDSAGVQLDEDSGPGELGAGLSGGGLPVGVAAPDFSLEAADGERRSLKSLRSAGSNVMLVFSDAGCGPCDVLMPELAGWQRQHRDRLRIVVVASGDEERTRAKAEEHGLSLVLIQPEREVSEAYQAHGTPMAVVVGTDGLIMSPAVGGVDAIRTLVEQAARPMLAVRQVPLEDGNGNRNAHGAAKADPDISRVGEPAPELVLEDLDGERIALKDLYAERTVAIFWNPGCGFCQRMLPDLQALEASSPTGAPRLIVITSGDLEQTREHALRSQVLVDPESEAMSAFGAGGTPIGVLVENGRIASPPAAGADAVFELIRVGGRAADAVDGASTGNGGRP
jgi:peroxiredoxin/uncharacterized membrane protein YphA (DoxX/SURF4 family)